MDEYKHITEDVIATVQCRLWVFPNRFLCTYRHVYRFLSGATVLWSDLSCSKLSGYFEPGGNKGGGFPSSSFGASVASFEGLEEFPAFPDLTIPFLGGIRGAKVTIN